MRSQRPAGIVEGDTIQTPASLKAPVDTGAVNPDISHLCARSQAFLWCTLKPPESEILLGEENQWHQMDDYSSAEQIKYTDTAL